jgi:GTP-binding protein EngB required for normal cell division
VILALTKSDKLKPMRRAQRVAEMRRDTDLPDDRVVATSAEKGLGIEELWHAIDALL